VVVLGARAGEITRHLQDTEVVQHADWSRGRLSSLQAGLRALPNASGYLILPVDTVGVRVQTLQLVLRCARQEGVAAVRPFYEGKPGRLVWIRADLARAVLDLPPVDTPMDEWLAPRVKAISVEDAAILSNVNTPDDWTAARTNL
jgi:molybdenum cofactor cytidylyltransferase